VTKLPQVGVETLRKVRRLPVTFPHGSTGARAAGDDRAGPEPGSRVRWALLHGGLGEPFALPPDVLLQQGRPQLEHVLGALLEHAQDRLSVGDG
jgi:hypothetical protein